MQFLMNRNQRRREGREALKAKKQQNGKEGALVELMATDANEHSSCSNNRSQLDRQFATENMDAIQGEHRREPFRGQRRSRTSAGFKRKNSSFQRKESQEESRRSGGEGTYFEWPRPDNRTGSGPGDVGSIQKDDGKICICRADDPTVQIILQSEGIVGKRNKGKSGGKYFDDIPERSLHLEYLQASQFSEQES